MTSVRRQRRTPGWLLCAPIVAGVGAATTFALAGAPDRAAPSVSALSTPAPGGSPSLPAPVLTTATPSPLPSPIHPDVLAALPEARFDAIVPGLLAVTDPIDTGGRSVVVELTHDIPLYGEDRTAPVARLLARDFLGEPTRVLAVGEEPGWTLVLTPARQSLPSERGGHAPAQTAAWTPTAGRGVTRTIDTEVVVEVAAQALTVRSGSHREVFAVGVGADGTPTPTNVTGYLEARYVDSSQGSGDLAINLTSLHSTTADEPFPGSVGGLIGMHYSATTTGRVSHGCIRLTAEALAAVGALPLGTPVTIRP